MAAEFGVLVMGVGCRDKIGKDWSVWGGDLG